MGQRYRRVIEHLKSKDLVIEDKLKVSLPKQYKENYFHKRGNENYELTNQII